MLEPLISYFTNAGTIPRNASESFQIKILLTSCAATSILTSPFMVYWAYASEMQSMQFYLLLGLIVALVLAPFLYKVTKSVVLSGLFTNVVSLVVLISFTWIDGGLYSAAIVWYPILPLFAGFYAKLRYASVVTLILVLSLVIIFICHLYGLVPQPRIAGATLLMLYAGSAIAVSFLGLIMAKKFIEWSFEVQNELIRAGEAKNEFLSGVSHELRTPLNSILGFSEVLSEGYAGQLTEKQQRYTEHIHSSGKHLLSLVDDLLDITKMEAGQLDFHLQPVNVSELIKSIVEMLRGSALEKNIELKAELDESISTNPVVMDEIKVKQVLINLIANAIKFTPKEGTVTVGAKINDKRLIIEIVDSGPGVPDKYRQSVFERFFQLTQEGDSKNPGTGLGLTICKHFVEMHGGKIFLRDSQCGAHFVFELPTTLEPQLSA